MEENDRSPYKLVAIEESPTISEKQPIDRKLALRLDVRAIGIHLNRPPIPPSEKCSTLI
jgi:hypothetical protein